MGKLRVAVVSDLHATAQSEPNDTYICTIDPNHEKMDPFRHLPKLIREEGLTADLLLCAGDLSNRACGGGLRYAWQALQELQQHLEATRLVAVPGNHDLDSRFQQSEFDPKGALLNLEPSLPTGDDAIDNKYWARNYAFYRAESYKLLLINSSAYHGYGGAERITAQQREHTHGRISRSTLEAVRRELEGQKACSVNIALCHHHPARNNPFNDGDYSEMDGGAELLRMLSEDDAEWILIHGHKHYPHLELSAGTGGSSLVFGAGSFSAPLYAAAAAKTRNQFYIIEFAIDDEELCGPLMGHIEAWDYHALEGWRRSPSDSIIPYRTGFGNREHPKTVAARIYKFLKSNGATGYVTWKEVLASDRQMEFMFKQDMDSVERLLGEKGVRIIRDKWGQFEQLYLEAAQ